MNSRTRWLVSIRQKAVREQALGHSRARVYTDKRESAGQIISTKESRPMKPGFLLSLEQGEYRL